MENYKKILVSLVLIYIFFAANISISAPIKEYDINEISKHDNMKDCWMIIGNKVYDFSSYIPEHPTTPSMITKNCGKDATQAYANKGGIGGNHSKKANKLLEKYEIGILYRTQFSFQVP